MLFLTTAKQTESADAGFEPYSEKIENAGPLERTDRLGIDGSHTMSGSRQVDRHIPAVRSARAFASTLSHRRIFLACVLSLACVAFTVGCARKEPKTGESAALLEAVAKGSAADVERLLNDGANVDVRDSKGRTPLMLASSRGAVDIMLTLVAEGADPNAQDKFQWTPLMNAANKGAASAVAFLIGQGVDVNHSDWMGRTPLMIASAKGYRGVVIMLLTSGAQVDLKDRKGGTAFKRAKFKGRHAIAALLDSWR